MPEWKNREEDSKRIETRTSVRPAELFPFAAFFNVKKSIIKKKPDK
jgi:hypothetical protein